MRGTGARCMCGSMLTDSWTQPRTALVYDGSTLDYSPGSDHLLSEGAGKAHLAGEEDAPEKEKGMVREGRGKGWWYQVEWI